MGSCHSYCGLYEIVPIFTVSNDRCLEQEKNAYFQGRHFLPLETSEQNHLYIFAINEPCTEI